jgi:NADPH:quinone reductase-like Zn-dependent oxidoreductase
VIVNSLFYRNIKSLYTVIGFLTGQTTNLDLMKIIFKQTKIQGIEVGHRKAFEEMNKGFDHYSIKPVIDTVYPFEKAIEANQHFSLSRLFFMKPVAGFLLSFWLCH